jgi:hypothetical protein
LLQLDNFPRVANDLRGFAALSSDWLLFEYDRRRAGAEASASERDPGMSFEYRNRYRWAALAATRVNSRAKN